MKAIAALLALGTAQTSQDNTLFLQGFTSSLLGEQVIVGQQNIFYCIVDSTEIVLEIWLSVEDWIKGDYLLLADGIKQLGGALELTADAMIDCAPSTRDVQALS